MTATATVVISLTELRTQRSRSVWRRLSGEDGDQAILVLEVHAEPTAAYGAEPDFRVPNKRARPKGRVNPDAVGVPPAIAGEADHSEIENLDAQPDWERLGELADYSANGSSILSPKPELPAERGPARYANACLIDRVEDVSLNQQIPLRPGQQFRLRLDIGSLDRRSHVREPTPLPSLPDDVTLDVEVTSNDFQVGTSWDNLGRLNVARGRFIVPGGGLAARNEKGERYLIFHLVAPETPRIAQARVAYHFRNVTVQAQRIEAEVTTGPGERRPAFEIVTDFTTSESLTDVARIPHGRAIGVMAGDQVDGRYRFVVRGATNDLGEKETRAFELDANTIGPLVDEIRTVLRTRAPTRLRRSRRELEADLWSLAPLGWELYTALPGQCSALFDGAFKDPEHNVIQVYRPNTASFTLPWTLVYEIPLNAGAVETRGLSLCPIVERWKDGPLLADGPRRVCPEGHVGESDVLCPFGFWGYKYSIEQLVAARTPEMRIKLPPRFVLVTGETRYDINARELNAHVDRLLRIFQARFPKAALERGTSTRDLQRLLGDDVPVVYFYCHGERLPRRRADTVLGIGHREPFTVGDFTGWVDNWRRTTGRRIWDAVRPLVVINACHSVEVNPGTLATYIDAFVGRANAAGVIGTEVRVDQTLAMSFVEDFFRLFGAGRSLDQAMRETRLHFLREGNLIGLSYSAFAWCDLQFGD
jgi:hypothetical protein